MTLQPRSSGIFFGGCPEHSEPPTRRTRISRTIRSTVCTCSLMIATGAAAVVWTGHHALGQSRVTLRATVEHEDQPVEVRRAALSALFRDAKQDIERLRWLAENDDGQLGNDARLYLERLSALTR